MTSVQHQNMDECITDKNREQYKGEQSNISQLDLGPTQDLGELYDKKTSAYTTALGSYSAWSLNVNLAPPNGAPVPDEDDKIFDYYNALQYTLYENNLPETVDRSDTPRTNYTDNDVTICILSSPVECMAIVLDGGRKTPGNMLLVMSTTWLEKRKSDRKSGLHSLYVYKAVSFDCAGKTFIDTYDPPRRVTYFIDFFTHAVTDGQRNDGEELEMDLECPMSSSLSLLEMTDDKLWTRIQLAKTGAYYPETLALVYKPRMEYPDDVFDISVVKLDTKVGVEKLIYDKVQEFSELIQGTHSHITKLVVKPSGTVWHGSLGVSFHSLTDVKSMTTAAMGVLAGLNPGDAVLVEGFYSTTLANIIKKTRKATIENLDQYSFRLRATCCRGYGNRPVCTNLICGVGQKSGPINGDNTIPQSFDSTLRTWGLRRVERDRICDITKRSSEALLEAIIKHENNMSDDERGGVGAQTDVIGIDFVLGRKNNQLVPVSIEVNGHDCTINCQLYEFMNPAAKGNSVGPLVDTMIQRSQNFIMKGKKLLVIGGGDTNSQVYEKAKEMDIKLVIVDSNKDSSASDDVDDYIYYDFTDHKRDDQHCKHIVEDLKNGKHKISGCCTFYEDCVPLCALVSDAMNLNGMGVTGAQVCKCKSLTQNTLMTRTADIPHFPRTYLYASKAHHLSGPEDIDPALADVGLPAVLKLEYGSNAVGAYCVESAEECKEQYNEVQTGLTSDEEFPGIGLGHGNSMMIMEYIKGTEHDVDLILFKRQLIAAFVSDNGPTQEGNFTETAACMPSCLPTDKRNQMVTAAYQCVVEIGLTDGVFNVEMMMTPMGPKLIEINGRIGSTYNRDWIKRVYDIDIMESVFMISARVKPYLPKVTANTQITGVMTIPSAHGHLFCDPEFMERLSKLEEEGEIFRNDVKTDYERSKKALAFEEPICNIAMTGENFTEINNKLIELTTDLGINHDGYDVPEFLSYFHDDS